jgi:hypothetical protein
MWEVNPLRPTAGSWFPGGDARIPLPDGEYVWEVHLLGETPDGEEEILVRSQATTFTIRAPERDVTVSAHAPSEASSPTQESSTRTATNATLTLMPKAGLFLSGVSSFGDISGEAASVLDGEQSVLAWGGSIAFGSRNGPVNLRLTGLHTTGSLVSAPEGATADGSAVRDQVFALTGDLVARPIPRFIVQPYGIGGLGARRLSVQQLEEFDPGSQWDLTAQVGVGVDVRVGNVTIGLEAVDYLTGFAETDSDVQHDAFLFLALGIPIF